MRKIIVVIGSVIAIVIIAMIGLRIYTKQFSPNETVTYTNNDLEISVNYSRPYKKDRVIFGELVPYNEVWRTGANEATIFKTNKSLIIKGKELPAGEYSLFTKPGEETWEIIFNAETGQWGVSPTSGEANRTAENDVLTTEVTSVSTPDIFEQFTIAFEPMGEEIEMILMWDQTLVVVPIEIRN